MEAFGDPQHHSVTVVDVEKTEPSHILWEYWSHYVASSAGGGVAANVMENQVLGGDDDGAGECGGGALSHYLCHVCH